MLKKYASIAESRDAKVKRGNLFTSHIIDIGKTLDSYKNVLTLESFFKSPEWLHFAEKHLAEVIRKEAAKLPGKENQLLDESISMDYEEALNGADFDCGSKLFKDFADDFGSSAVDDDPWKQFNDFSPEEVVIEGLCGEEADENLNDQAFRLSEVMDKKPNLNEGEMEDPFEFMVLGNDNVPKTVEKEAETQEENQEFHVCDPVVEVEDKKAVVVDAPQEAVTPLEQPVEKTPTPVETPVEPEEEPEFAEAPETI